MRNSLAVLFLVAVLPLTLSCDTMQEAAAPAGRMNPDGSINQCHGWESQKKLCGEAKFFSSVIVGVKIGQTPEEVLAVMKRQPWRKNMDADGERWGYPTSYEDERMVWITFRDGKVVSMSEASWEETE